MSNDNSDELHFGYTTIKDDQATHAAKSWWDANANEYHDEHDVFLRGLGFVWGPEGLTEETAQLLGQPETLRGKRVLEIGAGGAQCSSWLQQHGALTCATDISPGMLSHAEKSVMPLAADARALPFASDSFDIVFTSFGALQFVPDAQRIHQEVARVLRPGGQWTFSVTHPSRWMFPDDPTHQGMTIVRPYFDRAPYVEFADNGDVEYAEYHRTIGDYVNDVVTAGFSLTALIEPAWQEENSAVWGGWGPERGAYLPGTLIVSAKTA
ncbi:class I SAM-dependent methyltransferase [Jonesia quinghaiensis]|uniref:class I SAM-dependent methyltransferase n=1 Tax=Jonesia quinghaiensis TaxID=262806 RepID=UPI0004237A09|nr:class I SAM-dependent methyltransferase [Jonesia quinghaiensis]